MQLEDLGIPTVVLTTDAFLEMTKEVARTLGLPRARISVIRHPLGGISEADVTARANAVVEETLALLK